VLLAISITGIGVVFPGIVRPVVGRLSKATPDPSPSIETLLPKGTPQLSPDEIMRVAQATKPTMSITVLNPPTEISKPWRVRFHPNDADPALRSRGAI
jgi:hypothetical protein